jgi:hypothetical protein
MQQSKCVEASEKLSVTCKNKTYWVRTSFYSKESWAHGVIKVMYMPIKYQEAHLFTKSLGRHEFEELRGGVKIVWNLLHIMNYFVLYKS